jgi:hypothetical protein
LPFKSIGSNPGFTAILILPTLGVMRDLLQKAGFEVVVSTASNQPLVAGSAKLKPGVTKIYDRYSYDAEKKEALEAWNRRVTVLISDLKEANSENEF